MNTPNSDTKRQYDRNIREAVRFANSTGDFSMLSMVALARDALLTAQRMCVSAHDASILFAAALVELSPDFATRLVQSRD